MGARMSVNIYVDGFNLYYGALRRTPYKWLNLAAMGQLLLPGQEINRIRYFTANILPYSRDPQMSDRQEIYFRALRTLPNLTIHYGRFSAHPITAPRYPLVYPDPAGPPEMVSILKTEEKRSDVNLATLLLVDCFDNDFDAAVVITNDADLTLPIEYVVSRFGKPVGVINPHTRSRISRELIRAASWHYRQINRSVLARSQFPATLRDAQGEFRKPARW